MADLSQYAASTRLFLTFCPYESSAVTGEASPSTVFVAVFIGGRKRFFQAGSVSQPLLQLTTNNLVTFVTFSKNPNPNCNHGFYQQV